MSDLTTITLLSIKVALLATIVVIPVGTLMAWWLSSTKSRLRPICEAVILVPMIMPPVAVGLILLNLFSVTGPLGNLIYSIFGTQIILTWKAAVVAAAVVALPLYVKAAQGAFMAIPARYKYVAQTMGKTPLQIFIFVTIPMSLRGMFNGAILSFARGLGEFGATVLVAGIIPGETETLALGIYDRIINGRDSEAWGLVGISLCLALGALLFSQWLQHKQTLDSRGAR